MSNQIICNLTTEVTSMTPQSNCLLCYRVCKNNAKTLTGTDHETFEDQIAVIFVLRQLLQIPKSFCEILLLQSGNPAGWITSCQNCNELVNNAHSVFRKLTTLQIEYQSLINKAKEILINSRSKTDGITDCNKTTDHIRNYIFSDLGTTSILAKPNDDDISKITSYVDREVEIAWQEDCGEDCDCPEISDEQSPLYNVVSDDALKPTPTKIEPSEYEVEILEYTTDKQEYSANDAVFVFDATGNEILEESNHSDKNELNSGEKVIKTEKHIPRKRKENLTCQICQKIFRSPRKLETHQRRFHLEELNLEPFKCEDCGIIFKIEKYLNVHIKMKHKKEYSEFCSVCNAGFIYKYQLNRHIRDKHEERDKLICSFCTKTFSDMRNLKYHEDLKHMFNFKFTCEICGHGSATHNRHRQHMVKHSELRTHICELCGTAFKRENSLADHRRGEHYEELNLEPFQCSLCVKIFKSRAEMNKHTVLQHTKKLNFSCSECDERFYANTHLQKHLKRFHGEQNTAATSQDSKA